MVLKLLSMVRWHTTVFFINQGEKEIRMLDGTSSNDYDV